MDNELKTYRIRTKVGEDKPTVINIPLKQTYDTFEILSLKLDQTNSYKYYSSNYGVIVGRVLANGGVGIPNAKVSIFIESDETTADIKKYILYHYSSVQSTDNDGIRYNLLPDEIDEACHQNVGTFPNKRLVLDNKDVMEIFDKYWKYTTVTNEAGDYMLFGIPTGSQQLHVDIDLSDIGIWSQRPRDLVYKGYNINQFDSPNKFKTDTNLNSLSQIYSQDRGLYVYPYWGETTENGDTIGITRCDIQIDYKFEPTCIFMGSIVTDKGNNAIGKNCTGTDSVGKMSDLSTGEGSIEMIRKTLDNKVEQVQIKGNRVIDGDGVWCYQIPMNLDYVMTDEFGNLVPSDNPDRGIPTRTRVRFRISLDEQPNDGSARKRCKYLVPNNPHIDDEGFKENLDADYEFGSATREESYCDMFWNKVYTVKNYIPRLQKNSRVTNRKHTGIKLINHYGDNNPMPYNGLSIKLTFTFRLICVITKVFINLVGFINNLISILGYLPCWLGSKCLKIWKFKICPFKFLLKLIPGCIELSSEFCDDGINKNIYYPGCGKPFGCVWDKKTKKECQQSQSKKNKEEQMKCTNSSAQLYTCVENELAQSNDATSFNFYNDWINGSLYAPLWYRKITPKKSFLFGLFKRKAKDEWCSADREFGSLRLMQACAVARPAAKMTYNNFDGKSTTMRIVNGDQCGNKCHETVQNQDVNNGVISPKLTMLGQTVYYYRAVEYDPTATQESNNGVRGAIKTLFATDIVLLGSLNDCDTHGIPQFFKDLDSSTYNLPSDILFTDNEIINTFDDNGNLTDVKYTSSTEMTGCDWGNKNEFGKEDGGLFYGIGCSTIEMQTKSCVNLSRICEFGVSLDESKYVPNLKNLNGDESAYDLLIADGFVSYDELYNLDGRSMFATMNGNRLKTKLNTTNGLREYDFRYLYPESFDGSLEKIMQNRTGSYSNNVNYKNNYNLETASRDYYIFRMGNNPYYYDKDYRFPRYENSFYFYFGLKNGKTAIEKFNSQFFSECETVNGQEASIGIKVSPNSWCTNETNNRDGFVALDVSGISTPYDIILNSTTNLSYSASASGITSEKIIIKGNGADADEIKKLTDKGYTIFDGIKNLENGEYQLTITDADGEITTSTFRMVAPYLTYKTYVDKFNQPNNVLQSEYTNFAAIANDKKSIAKDIAQVIEGSADSREIGGVIIIYDIYFNNEPLKNYKIEIQPNASDFTNDGSYVPVTYNSNGTSSGNGFLGKIGDYLVFGLPKGDVRYNVTVIQQCNGNDSKNSVEKSLLVEQPTPYKLYINDVDYDVIKDGFNCGWTISGKTDNIKLSRGNSVKGWLTNLDNIDDFIGDNNGLFNWDNNDTYKLEYYIDNMDDYRLNPDKYVDNVEEWKEARRQFINSFKETFYLSCPSDSLTINVSARTDDNPYVTGIVYRPEMISSDEEFNTLDGCDSKFLTTDNQIDDIKIPTITNFDNTRYGGGDKLTDAKIQDAVFARDVNNDSCKKEAMYKHPYFVAVVNSKGKTIATSNVGTSKDNDSYTLNGNIAGYFGFHIIDRMLVNNFISWAYITDIPYFKPIQLSQRGKNVTNKEGLFAGILYNGSPTSVDTDGKTSFESQTLSGVPFEITTVSDGTSMATKRVITGPNLLKTYVNYTVDKQVNAYVTLPPISARMNIEDSNGCQVDETIFGGMRMTAGGSSVNNIMTGERILRVNLANADSSGDTYFYIYSTNGGYLYPINCIKIDDKTINMFDDKEWTNDNASYRLFNYKTSKETLQKYVDGGVKSTVPNKEDASIADESKGYGTTGNFTSIGGGKSYYVVAVTENNCRAISPVFDFVNLNGVVEVSKIYSKLEDGTEEIEEEVPLLDDEGNPVLNEDGTPKMEIVTKTVTKYKDSEDNMIGFYIDGLDADSNEPYYFNKYRYSLEATCEMDSLHKVTASGELSGGTNSPIYALTDSSTFDLLNKYTSLPFNMGNNMIKKKTTFTAIDYTGLTHVFAANKLTKKDRYRVLLSLNDQEGKGTYHFTETDPSEDDYVDRVLYLEKDYIYELPYVYDDDGAKIMFWSTLKEAKWNSEKQEGELRMPPKSVGLHVIESMIWYAVWHTTEYVTFTCDVNGGGMWSDGTTDNSLSEITVTSKVICPKGNPVNTDTIKHFGGWQCDDTSVVIKEDGTVITDHSCTVYPKWITSHTVRWMDNDI